MARPSLEQVIDALNRSWATDTAFDAGQWTHDNPARGQCVVSCLVMQDFFGGDLMGFYVEGPNFSETHYVNVLPNGTIIDTTGQQYKEAVSLKVKPSDLKGFTSLREKLRAGGDTAIRYERLKARVLAALNTR